MSPRPPSLPAGCGREVTLSTHPSRPESTASSRVREARVPGQSPDV